MKSGSRARAGERLEGRGDLAIWGIRDPRSPIGNDGLWLTRRGKAATKFRLTAKTPQSPRAAKKRVEDGMFQPSDTHGDSWRSWRLGGESAASTPTRRPVSARTMDRCARAPTPTRKGPPMPRNPPPPSRNPNQRFLFRSLTSFQVRLFRVRTFRPGFRGLTASHTGRPAAAARARSHSS